MIVSIEINNYGFDNNPLAGINPTVKSEKEIKSGVGEIKGN